MAKSREGALKAILRSVSGPMLLGYFLLHQVVSACKCCSGVDGQYLPVKKDAVLVRSIKREWNSHLEFHLLPRSWNSMFSSRLSSSV